MAKNAKVDKGEGGGGISKFQFDQIESAYADYPNNKNARRNAVMEVLTKPKHKPSERPARPARPSSAISKQAAPSPQKTPKQPGRKR